MCKDFEEKVNSPLPLLSSPSLFTHQSHKRAKKKKTTTHLCTARRTPKTKSHNIVMHKSHHCGVGAKDATCVKIRPRARPLFCVCVLVSLSLESH